MIFSSSDKPRKSTPNMLARLSRGTDSIALAKFHDETQSHDLDVHFSRNIPELWLSPIGAVIKKTFHSDDSC